MLKSKLFQNKHVVSNSDCIKLIRSTLLTWFVAYYWQTCNILDGPDASIAAVISAIDGISWDVGQTTCTGFMNGQVQLMQIRRLFRRDGVIAHLLFTQHTMGVQGSVMFHLIRIANICLHNDTINVLLLVVFVSEYRSWLLSSAYTSTCCPCRWCSCWH